jgi:hypothetical protein
MIGDESIDALKLAVSMIFLSVILGSVAFMIALSKGYYTEFFNTVDQREESTAISVFTSFGGEGKELPTASAYAVIAYNSDHISGIYVKGYDGISGTDVYTEAEVLGMNLSGRCRLMAEEDGNSGTFYLILEAR